MRIQNAFFQSSKDKQNFASLDSINGREFSLITWLIYSHEFQLADY